MNNKNQNDNFAKYFHQLCEESERGSAIVGAALIDDALKEMLKALMVESTKKDDELFKNSYAPLNSLSAKIDFTYRMGLISKEVRTSLHIIQKIRNSFAHVSCQISFETQLIQDRVQTLFNLNKSILNLMWEIIENNFKCKFDNLINNIGWIMTYNLLISIILTTMHEMKTNIPRIISHHQDGEN